MTVDGSTPRTRLAGRGEVDAVTRVFQEQRLYRRVTGRRRALIGSALGLANVIGVLWLLVGLGVLPPTPTNKISVLATIPATLVPFACLWDNPGETRTWLERLSSMTYLWLQIGAAIELCWELPWVILDLTHTIRGATASNHWLWSWWIYGSADTRYLSGDTIVFAIEFTTVILGFLELYALVLFRTGRYRSGNWLALIVGWTICWVGVPFLVAAAYNGFDDIKGGPFNFWVVFIGMNVPWLFAPIFIVWGRIAEINYWHRRDIYRQLADSGVDVEIRPAIDVGIDPTAGDPLLAKGISELTAGADPVVDERLIDRV